MIIDFAIIFRDGLGRLRIFGSGIHGPLNFNLNSRHVQRGGTWMCIFELSQHLNVACVGNLFLSRNIFLNLSLDLFDAGETQAQALIVES